MCVNTFPARGPSSSASNKLTSWVCVNRILDHTDKAIRLQIVSAVGLMGTLLICLIVLYFTGLANDMLLLNKFSTVKNIDIFLHEVYWAGQYTSRFTWNIHHYVILSWNLFALEKKGFKVCLLYLFVQEKGWRKLWVGWWGIRFDNPVCWGRGEGLCMTPVWIWNLFMSYFEWSYYFTGV